MELRGCSHLHFISVIRGGEVIKVPNISRTQKVLKFKNISEIIGFDDCVDSLAELPPKVDRSLDSPFVGEGANTKIKIEYTEEDSDTDICGMTLKQFKDTCKSKKRKKFSTAVKQECNNLRLQEDETDLNEIIGSWKHKLSKKRKVKRTSSTNSTPITSETDILGERLKEIPSDLALHKTSEENFRPDKVKVEIVEPEYSQPQVTSVFAGDNPNNVTCEIPGGSDLCSEQVKETTLEDLQGGNLSETSSQLIEPIPIPIEILYSDLIQVSQEFEEIKIMSPSQESSELLGHIQLKPPLICEDSEMENIAHLGDMANLGNNCPDLPISEWGNDENMADLRILDNAPDIVMSECESSNALQGLPCRDKLVQEQQLHTGHANSCHYVEFIENGKSIEFIVDNENSEPEISVSVADCSSIVPSGTCLLPTNDGVPTDALKFATEDKEVSMLNDSVAPLVSSPNVQHYENTDEVNRSASNESYQDKEVVHPPERLFSAGKVLPCKDGSLQEQHLGTGDANSCQYVEFVKNGKSIEFIDDNENSEAGVSRSLGDCSSIVTSDTCLPSTDDVAPTDALTSAAEDKELSVFNDSVATLACSPNVQHNEDIDEVNGSTLNESCQDKEVVHPPERLFSARKTISPNSQRRLCRALNSIDLQHDSDVNYCKEKLPFEKDCDDRSSSSWPDVKRGHDTLKGHEASNSAEIVNNQRQSAKKGKEERKGLRFKGMVKNPHTSPMSQRAANDCSSVQSCSRNAIKFSQQQLHDIERLTTKLLTELQSMKGIVIDGMQCESRAGAKSRYNTDEVRVAVENANKAEETTKKWLSIMTRDCNRFCKIMTLADANSASPETLSPEKNGQKERKKIVFADEAGGSLCHVRVFEAGMDIDSPVKSPTTDEKLSIYR